jgi:hypothetical protein
MSPEFVGPNTTWVGEWEHDPSAFEMPLRWAIPMAAKLAFERTDLRDLLQSLSPALTAANIDKAVATLKRIINRPAVFFSRYVREVVPGLKIHRAGFAEVETRIMSGVPDQVPNRYENPPNRHRQVLSIGPGAIAKMEYDADCGYPVGNVNGTMFGWSFIQAAWIEPSYGKPGYISIASKYGQAREWSQESLKWLHDWEEVVENEPLAAWASAKWKEARPLNIDLV